MIEEIEHEFYGRIKIFSEDKGICRHLKDKKTIWEKVIQQEFDKHYKGGSIIDIGAFIGLHSIALSKIGVSKIHAFECQPASFDLLKFNTANLEVKCHSVILSDTNTQRYIRTSDFGKTNNFAGVGTYEKSSSETIEVKTATLDSFNLDNIGLMKIDVEGHELQVLRGAEKTIRSSKPTIFIEIMGGVSNPSKEQLKLITDTHDFLLSLGYKMEKKFTEHDYLYTPI